MTTLIDEEKFVMKMILAFQKKVQGTMNWIR